MNGRYLSANEYMKSKFGEKVYRLSLDGGMTCPNRDGKIDKRGCIFCSAGGSGEFAAHRSLGITAQIEQAKKRVEGKYTGHSFVAYFQAYTNTYASTDYLREIFTEAINHPDIVALSIATRPDCLQDEVLALLDELNHVKPVWVELGLQTIHEDSARYIRRGYTLDVFDRAVEDLHSIGVEVIAHMIIGLPGETREDMIATARHIADRGVEGIKLQLLHVLRGTDLAIDYEKGLFKTLELDEYIDILCDIVEILPRDMVIHRLTGDGDKKLLISPLWSGDKKRVLNTINKVFCDRDIVQGKRLPSL